METCAAITKKGTRCTRKAINNDRCKMHDHGPAPVYQFGGKCITLTFSNCVENNQEMEMIGDINNYHPFTVQQLQTLYNNYVGEKELIHLTLNEPHEPAAVLVLRKFCQNADSLFQDLTALTWDSKAIFKGVVKNKNARHNLCFANFSQEADYEAGKGTVIKIQTIPNLLNLQTQIEQLTGFAEMNAEGNYYFNVETCGISYHGDAERNIVIGVRFGDSIPLCFQWYHRFKPIGEKFTIQLNHSDLYIMSEKAVGQDWKKSSQITLRHSAGCAKYTSTK